MGQVCGELEGRNQDAESPFFKHNKNTDQRKSLRELGIVTTSEQGFQGGRPGTRDIPYYTLLLGCRE